MLNEYKEILNVTEVSEILKISELKLYKLIQEGQIKYFKVGKSIRILKSDLIEYINRNIITTQKSVSA